MQVQTHDIRRGLKDVYFDKTTASFIDGAVGKLLYRGYSIHDLAEQSTFEEVIHLLLYGKLPTRKELDELDATLRANRELPEEVTQVIRIVQKAHPMDVLRTAVS
ncbi:MAG: citrate/2-methylcitrate synthase, partial [Chloroflexota bacterium]|nr:citrate/2-methylcitrate synthase [Chloroflexota bacterium]